MSTMRLRHLRLVAVAAAVAMLAACNSPTDDFQDMGHATSDTIANQLRSLPVQQEQPDGYDRDDWPHWRDTDDDGCNARDQVLVAEEVTGGLTESDCGAPMTGEWTSLYDNETATSSSELDVDHVVALSEAWASGAHAWDRGQRTAYANATEPGWHLVAVTASSNRSKGDSDPAEWMPSDEGFRCEYAWMWIQVKTDWGLSVDAAELAALTDQINAC